MIENLIHLLRFIPSGDNAQPFRYKIDADSMSVFHDSEIAKHSFNQSNVASLLSLGMIVEVISKFAEDNQLKINFEYASDFLKEDLWLKVNFKNQNEGFNAIDKNNAHLSLMKERKTFRGLFKKAKFDFDSMNKEFSGQVIFTPKISKKVYDLIYKMEILMFDDYVAFKDIESWFRYSTADLHKFKTGMSLTNLGVDPVNGSILRLWGRVKGLSFLLAPYFKILTYLKVHVLYPQAVGFGLVMANGNDNAAVINAGRSLIAAWLKLTNMNMAIQPISSASLLPFEFNYRQAQFLKKYESALKQADLILKNQFKYETGVGIWLFRFGVPDKTVNKKNYRTLRLETADLMKKN